MRRVDTVKKHTNFPIWFVAKSVIDSIKRSQYMERMELQTSAAVSASSQTKPETKSHPSAM